MNDDEAFNLINEKTPIINNMYWNYSGHLVTDGKCFALIDEECNVCMHLPLFIKSYGDAENYIRHLQNNYTLGIGDGRRQFKRDFRDLIKL